MRISRRWLGAELFTGLLVSLVAVAITDAYFIFVAVQIAIILVTVGAIHWMFPGGRFFAIALANFIAVYACLYVFLLEANFGGMDRWAVFPGFALPIVAFLAGAWWRRDSIRRIVETPTLREERHFARLLVWLAPLVLIGATTFVIPLGSFGPASIDLLLLGLMAVIGAIIFVVSGVIATFLIDSGLLFEQFFERARELIVPAFAFFTFYSLIIIVFAAVYRIIDRFSPTAQFLIHGAQREITFSDSLFFSIVTLSTVGYGEIVPATDVVRVIVAFQIICGVLLLLFGFHEIVTYAREHRGTRRDGP
jgi:voltage-gated potassium channel